MKEYRPRLTPSEMALVQKFRAGSEEKRILIIGDLHAPFVKKGYLDHCRTIYDKHQCNHVILIGDIIDNHYSSFHGTDPDGFAAGEELDRAVSQISEWHDSFPGAEVVIGNHDRIIVRKAFAAGVSNRWIKDYADVLETPSWNFALHYEYDDVLYIHGEGAGGINGALSKALNKRKSIVQGHFHTESHIRWNASSEDLLFGMQIGCGIDDEAYALAYAKYNTKKSIISCGVVLDGGKRPMIEPMRL